MNRLPPYLIKRVPKQSNMRRIRQLLDDPTLHTVCESAQCPNIGECFQRSTLTFMILGNSCTRACRFCAVPAGRQGVSKGLPQMVDLEEPQKIKRAVKKLGIKYAVITSVTRDDLEDGGAFQFVRVIRALKELGDVRVEVLIPDLLGDEKALDQVLGAGPDVLNHNVETAPRLYKKVRPQADYKRSLKVLSYAKGRGAAYIKSGFMVGLGEEDREVTNILADLGQAGCDLVTIGQYLRPSRQNLEVSRYVHPDIFDEYKKKGESFGIKEVMAGPFVRSSYKAEMLWKKHKD